MSPKSLRSHPLAIGLVGGGLVILALAVVAGWIVLPCLVNQFVSKSAVLQEDTQRFKVWQNPGNFIDVYMKFYFFNVTNPLQVAKGEKPIVQEVGPYSYIEKRSKIVLENSETTIRYKEKFEAYFSKNTSNGRTDSERITFVNIPLIGAIKSASDRIRIPLILEALQLLLNGERLFRTESVKSILFQGFSVQTYVDLLTNPVVEFAVGRQRIPSSLQGGKFAVYKNKNGSAEEEYEVYNGKDSHDNFGKIKTWQNLTQLSWWKSASCNKIFGSDGTTYPPFLTEHSILHAFVPELCRVISLKFEEYRGFYDIPVYRFSVPFDEFQAPARSENNRCYCTEKDLKSCDSDGIISLAACREGAPVSLSLPHFLAADRKAREAVIGLGPSDKIHKTFFDIEPTTGVVVAVAKRLQFNVQLKPYPELPMLAKVPKMTFPLFWVEESFEIPETIRKQVRLLHNTKQKLKTARWAFVGVSLVCITLGIAWMLSVKLENAVV